MCVLDWLFKSHSPSPPHYRHWHHKWAKRMEVAMHFWQRRRRHAGQPAILFAEWIELSVNAARRWNKMHNMYNKLCRLVFIIIINASSSTFCSFITFLHHTPSRTYIHSFLHVPQRAIRTSHFQFFHSSIFFSFFSHYYFPHYIIRVRVPALNEMHIGIASSFVALAIYLRRLH